jgi:hypothetical protein
MSSHKPETFAEQTNDTGIPLLMFIADIVTRDPPDYDQSDKSKHAIVIKLYNFNGCMNLYV